MLRFASSPTSDMHIGNLRVAIFNYIVSCQKNEDLLIRIEDTDTQRNIEGKDQEILDLLALFGIEYSHVVYQSQNFRFHSAMALQLMHEKKAFSCFCSPEWIEKKKGEAIEHGVAYRYDDACANLPAELVIDNMNPFSIRIKKSEKPIVIRDYIKGEISFASDELESFVIMNQDKTPTYNFACAVDDMLSDISLVIRSEEYINNTPKQELVRRSLGYDKKIEYAHIPTILGDTPSVKWLLEEGYLPSSISNYLISIGNKSEKDIFTIQEAIEWFQLEDISASPTRFEIDKLKFINRQHLKNLDAKELSRYVGFADAEIGELAKIYLEEVYTTKELRAKIKPIFEPKNIPPKFEKQAFGMFAVIAEAPYFEEYNDFKNYLMKETGLKDENFMQPLRILLTGAKDGPEIADLYKYLKNYIGEIVR